MAGRNGGTNGGGTDTFATKTDDDTERQIAHTLAHAIVFIVSICCLQNLRGRTNAGPAQAVFFSRTCSMSLDAWTFVSNDDFAVFHHRFAGTLLELSSASNGWFKFTANPKSKSQVCWSSTQLSNQDHDADELIQRLRGSEGNPLKYDIKFGNWSARSREDFFVVISNSHQENSEILFTASGFVYFYHDEKALVLHDGKASNKDAKEARQQVSKGDVGTHEQYHGQCMICRNCFFCTGYGRSCINCRSKDRSDDAGEACGCGGGQSGCRKCGMCRTCCKSLPRCEKVCNIDFNIV